MNVIEKIKQLLSERNWTVYRLAQESEITDKSIYKWMKGVSQPTVKAIFNICKAFGITPAEFFSEGNLIEVSDEIKCLYKDWTSLTKEEQAAIRALIKRKSK